MRGMMYPVTVIFSNAVPLAVFWSAGAAVTGVAGVSSDLTLTERNTHATEAMASAGMDRLLNIFLIPIPENRENVLGTTARRVLSTDSEIFSQGKLRRGPAEFPEMPCIEARINQGPNLVGSSEAAQCEFQYRLEACATLARQQSSAGILPVGFLSRCGYTSRDRTANERQRYRLEACATLGGPHDLRQI
jgi:hypothetical protein